LVLLVNVVVLFLVHGKTSLYSIAATVSIQSIVINRILKSHGSRAYF